LILVRTGIHKTKAGSFKLSQLYSAELSYSRSMASHLCSADALCKSVRFDRQGVRFVENQQLLEVGHVGT
jgi:hypothetical protein